MQPREKLLPIRHYSHQSCELFQRAITQSDPAVFLCKKKVRTLLFNLESLLRLLDTLNGTKHMHSYLKKIKKLEDHFSRIDNYEILHDTFSQNRKIKKVVLIYFKAKRDKAIKKLNKHLIEKEFYQDLFYEITQHVNINFNNRSLILKLKKQLSEEVKTCFEFYQEHKFNKMESEVHEIRRKLRWISIQAQSLHGLVVLHTTKTRYAWEKEMITKEEIRSEYNKLPVKAGLAEYIYFNKAAFLALSYVVTSLGKIKDKGLELESLAKAIAKTSMVLPERPVKEAMRQLGLKQGEDALYKETRALLDRFFDQFKIHELLIVHKKI